MADIELTQTERQLLLYDIFNRSEQVEFADITARLPVGRKMIQRVIQDLTAAGLLQVKYSRKDRAYIHDKVNLPSFDESVKGRMRVHLKKLNRIGRLMNELSTDESSYYEEDGDDYYSCKKSYYELFPDETERTRQRDFAVLNHIGYIVRYDNWERRYKMWDMGGLRENFGVYVENGKLMRRWE